MRFAVRYYTKTGNTKRLAEAIANELGVEALPISEPVKEQVDFLFLGNSYYAFDIDAEVKQFVTSLDKNMVGKIVNFGSAAMLNSTYFSPCGPSCTITLVPLPNGARAGRTQYSKIFSGFLWLS